LVPAAGDTRVPARVLLLPRVLIQRIMFYATLVGLWLGWESMAESLWVGVGFALTTFVVVHATFAARELPWLPGLTAGMACLQWIVAPWVAYHFAATIPVLPMSVPAAEYFALAVPATIGFVAGLYGPLRHLRGRPWASTGRFRDPGRRLRLVLELMFLGGLAIRILVVPTAPVNVRFALLLTANLSYVGAFGLTLLGVRAWQWRLALVLGVEAFFNTADAQFLDLMVWSAFSALLLIYIFRPPPRLVLGLSAVALAGVFALNVMKAGYRTALLDEEVERDERPAVAARTISQIAANPDLVFSMRNLGFNVNRLNQGWIVSRVVAWVPAMEPFAGGETILTAVRSAVVPRILDPDKPLAGGFDNFPRFTGWTLVGGTSMNLGMIGELYANFGATGSIVGCFAYGLLLSLLFRRIAHWAEASPLWWAWAPYLVVSTVSAELGTSEVLGQLVKSLAIFAAVTTLSRNWSTLRLTGPTSTPGAPPGNVHSSAAAAAARGAH
jgi:hypothetical protein